MPPHRVCPRARYVSGTPAPPVISLFYPCHVPSGGTDEPERPGICQLGRVQGAPPSTQGRDRPWQDYSGPDPGDLGEGVAWGV